MTAIDEIKALIALGDMFPDGNCEWEYGVSFGTAWGFVCDGQYIMRFEGCNDIYACSGSMEFIEAAANARPAIRELVERLERAEALLRRSTKFVTDHDAPQTKTLEYLSPSSEALHRATKIKDECELRREIDAFLEETK